MSAEPEVITDDISMIQPVGRAMEAVVEKAGQSMVARREQANVPAAVTPMDMIDRALVAGADPSTLEKLLALQERWEANQGRKAFDEAMASAKAEIPTIRKNRVVDFTSQKGRTHYKHEDLAEIARTVDPILARHGLSYRFRTSSEINQPVSVTCIVSHRAGYSEENTLVGPPDTSGNKNQLQQVGSTITFLQRYTLKAALGLAASDDDDGRSASRADDDGPISEEQAATIRAMCAETETDVPKFCELMNVDAIPELPASQYQRVIASLEAKKRRLAS